MSVLRKVALFGGLSASCFVRQRFSPDYVVCSPEKPAPRYSLHKLLLAAGIEMIDEADAARVLQRRKRAPLAVIRHDDQTWDEGGVPSMVNGACTDISKTHVDNVFFDVFGYRTKLDPLTFKGRAVKKSEVNNGVDGVFVECPLATAEVHSDYIYQRLVDNEISPGVVQEHRVSVCGGAVTEVSTTTRVASKRLHGRGSGGMSNVTVPVESVFSPEEIGKILLFCDRLGLDFGELDVLPDVPEGRIYILDANKTPTLLTTGSAINAERVRNLLRRAKALRSFLEDRRAGQGETTTP